MLRAEYVLSAVRIFFIQLEINNTTQSATSVISVCLYIFTSLLLTAK